MKRSIDCLNTGAVVAPFWNRMICGDRARLGLHADFRDNLRTAVNECGFRYLRQHGILCDELFVSAGPDAPLNFNYVYSLYDYYLSIGIRPLVELSFMPRWLARDDFTVFTVKLPAGVPKEWDAWRKLVGQFVRGLVARYGIDEVRRWPFEVWNEPDIPFWNGTQAEYFELYRHAVLAIKEIDADLRVGGPATACFQADADGVFQPKWVTDFTAFCDREKLPADFISAHPYPTDFPWDDARKAQLCLARERHATRRDLTRLRDLVRGGPFAKAEIHCDEWGLTPSWPDYLREMPYGASFVMENILESIGLVDSLAHWTFCDVAEEAPINRREFQGGWGLLTQHGIRKPIFHAYAFLNRVGDRLLHNEPGCAVFAGKGGWQVLLYHHTFLDRLKDDWREADTAETMLVRDSAKTFTLRLDNVPARLAVRTSRVDDNNGWAYRAWREMGSPDWPSAAEMRVLRDAEMPGVSSRTVTTGGSLDIQESVPAYGVMLLDITPA